MIMSNRRLSTKIDYLVLARILQRSYYILKFSVYDLRITIDKFTHYPPTCLCSTAILRAIQTKRRSTVKTRSPSRRSLLCTRPFSRKVSATTSVKRRYALSFDTVRTKMARTTIRGRQADFNPINKTENKVLSRTDLVEASLDDVFDAVSMFIHIAHLTAHALY